MVNSTTQTPKVTSNTQFPAIDACCTNEVRNEELIGQLDCGNRFSRTVISERYNRFEIYSTNL